MVKLKQYLENSWYRGASQDRQTGYASQYQYGYGVNTRDMRNGVCLAGGATDVVNNVTSPFSYFTYGGNLYYVTASGIIYNSAGTVMCNTGVQHSSAPNGIEFGNDIFIVGTGGVIRVDGLWNYTDITTQFPEYPDNSNLHYRGYGTCVLNYANTFLLIGDSNIVWKMEKASNGPVFTFTGIRNFESSYKVYGLTQEGNYLKIYTSNGINTKIHYAKGTFDVEYTGLVQTISFNGLALGGGDVASDQGYDYAIFAAASGEYKLAKVQGYSKIDIRWTQTWGGEKVFTATDPTIKSADGVLFAAMDDGIWTFTEYNGWLWGGCCEFPIASNETVLNMFKYGEHLYACIKAGDKYIVRYYDMSFHPTKYQPNGFIIGRVFDGGCAGLFKKNDQATITYNMPVGTGMELSYRYDRSSFGYDKSNFYLIKKLEDSNECYDIVVPTTPINNEISLLRKESSTDLITLENGNGIMLEDILVCPFNKTWNLLEYRFDLSTTDVSKTPILFEHSLTYYDYMRKYR